MELLVLYLTEMVIQPKTFLFLNRKNRQEKTKILYFTRGETNTINTQIIHTKYDYEKEVEDKYNSCEVNEIARKEAFKESAEKVNKIIANNNIQKENILEYKTEYSISGTGYTLEKEFSTVKVAQRFVTIKVTLSWWY